MHNGEWSLISFTLLSQLSVGLVLALGFLFFMHQTIFDGLNSGFSFRSLEFVILILILIATLLSLLHLGSPLHSYNSINNLKGSWISREILMLSVFGFGVLLFMLSRMMNWSQSITQVLLIFSMISGLIFIFAMIGIYMISTVPSWNNFYTPLSFLGSAVLLGSVGVVILISVSNPAAITSKLLSQILWIMITIGALIIFASLFHQYQISKLSNTGIEQIEFNKGPFFALFLIRIVMLIVVVSGLFYLMSQISNLHFEYSEIKIYFLLISMLILIEEVIGRYLFYGSYFRLGV